VVHGSMESVNAWRVEGMKDANLDDFCGSRRREFLQHSFHRLGSLLILESVQDRGSGVVYVRERKSDEIAQERC